MALLLILPLLVSGYLVCLKHPGYYCRLHRFEGQLLYMQVARLGWTCLVLAFVLTTVILCASKLPIHLTGRVISFDYSASLGRLLVEVNIADGKTNQLWVFFLQVGLTTMVIPFCWAWLFASWRRRRLNLASDQELNYQLTLETLKGRPLRTLLRDSIVYRFPCLFSMSDRKVYVGIVSYIGEPSESEGVDHAFNLVPMFSGFRDKDTLEITLGTHYQSAPSDHSIMLFQENVVSATRFDAATWVSFQTRKKPKNQPDGFYRRSACRSKKTLNTCA